MDFYYSPPLFNHHLPNRWPRTFFSRRSPAGFLLFNPPILITPSGYLRGTRIPGARELKWIINGENAEIVHVQNATGSKVQRGAAFFSLTAPPAMDPPIRPPGIWSVTNPRWRTSAHQEMPVVSDEVWETRPRGDRGRSCDGIRIYSVVFV